MLDPSEFGELVTFTPVIGLLFQVNGIFDREHSIADPGSEAGISSSGPQVLCRTSDVASVKNQDGVSVVSDPDSFIVVDRQPDGTGMTLLILQVV